MTDSRGCPCSSLPSPHLLQAFPGTGAPAAHTSMPSQPPPPACSLLSLTHGQVGLERAAHALAGDEDVERRHQRRLEVIPERHHADGPTVWVSCVDDAQELRELSRMGRGGELRVQCRACGCPCVADETTRERRAQMQLGVGAWRLRQRRRG